MLGPLPDDFRYVLGLHEAVAVGMADGFAQASGNVAHVNLHTAPGVGNGVGAIFNARANKAPLLVTAGQQARSLMTMQATLTNRDAVEVPRPHVKWSHEPRAPLTSRSRSRRRFTTRRCRRGVRRSCRSRWTTGRARSSRSTSRPRSRARWRAGRSRRSPQIAALAAAAARGAQPRVRGRAPRSTPAVAGTRRSSSSSLSVCPCGRLRPPAAGASASRRAMPPSKGCCRRRWGRWRRRSPATTWCSSPAPRCFRTTRTFPATSCRRAPSSSRSRTTPTRPRVRRWAMRSSPTSR